MVCVNYQGKRSNDQISPIVLSRILQIKNSTPAGNRVFEKAAGNTDSHISQVSTKPPPTAASSTLAEAVLQA